MPKPFELVYEGPIDDTSDTLRKVKAVFLAELNFSIEKTKEILEKAPLTVIRADEEIKITRFAQLLSSAGARVHIVVPELDEDTDDDLLDIEIEFDEPKRKQKVYSLTDDTAVEELHVESDEEEEGVYDISDVEESLLAIPEMMNLHIEAQSESVSGCDAQDLTQPKEDFSEDIQAETLNTQQEIIMSKEVVNDTFELSLGEKHIEPETEASLIRKMEEVEKKLSVVTDFSFNDDPLADRFQIPESSAKVDNSKNKNSAFDLSFTDEEPSEASSSEVPQTYSKAASDAQSWELSLGEVQEEISKPVQVNTKPVTPPQELDELFNSYETEEESASDSTFDFKEKSIELKSESVLVEEAPALLQEKSVSSENQTTKEVPLDEPRVSHAPQVKRKGSIPFTPIFCVLGILALWGLNHIYFSFTHFEEAPIPPQVIKPKKIQEPAPVEAKSFSKISLKDGVEVAATGEIQAGSIKSISIVVKNSTSGTLKVEKLLFEDIPVEDSADGKFSLHGPVRISIIDGRETVRVIGTGVVQGRLNNDTLSLSLDAKYQADSSEKNDSYIKKSGSGFSVSFQVSQVLR